MSAVDLNELADRIELIASIGYGSATLNSLPHIAKLADEAASDLRAAIAALSQPKGDGDVQPISPNVRAALYFALWHHQGGSSEVGQPIRAMLGMGQHEHMSAEQVASAKAYAAALSLPRQSEAVPVADVAISQGNFGQEDGSTIIGWRVSAETISKMGMASMCLPREIGEDLERLREIATWWQSGSTQRKDKLTLILNDTFPDDRPMRRHLWSQVLPLIDAIVTPQPAQADTPPAAHGVGDGMVVVPREPTDAMWQAFYEASGSPTDWMRPYEAYRAMIRAASAPGGSEDQQ